MAKTCHCSCSTCDRSHVDLFYSVCGHLTCFSCALGMNYQDRTGVLKSGRFRCSLCEFPLTMFVWHCQDINSDLVAPGVPLTFLSIQNSVHHSDANAERALFRKLNEYFILIDAILNDWMRDHQARAEKDTNYPWMIVSPSEHIDLPAFCEIAIKSHLDHWNPWMVCIGNSASMALMDAFYWDHLAAFKHLVCLLRTAQLLPAEQKETIRTKSLLEYESAIQRMLEEGEGSQHCKARSHPLPDLYLNTVEHTTRDGDQKCVFSVEIADFVPPFPVRVLRAALPKNIPRVTWKDLGGGQESERTCYGSRHFQFEAIKGGNPSRRDQAPGAESMPIHPYLSLALIGNLDAVDQREVENRLSRIRQANAKIGTEQREGSAATKCSYCSCTAGAGGDCLLWFPCLHRVCQKCLDDEAECVPCNKKWSAEAEQDEKELAEKDDLALLTELIVSVNRALEARIQSTPWQSGKEMGSLVHIHRIVSWIRANASAVLESGKGQAYPPLSTVKRTEALMKKYTSLIHEISRNRQSGFKPCRLDEFAKKLAQAAGPHPTYPQPKADSRELDLSDFLPQGPADNEHEANEEEEGDMNEITEMIFSPNGKESLDYVAVTFDLRRQLRCLALYVTGREVAREYLPDLPPPQDVQAYTRKGFTHIAMMLRGTAIYSFRLETCISAKALPKAWKEMEGHATFDPAFWKPDQKISDLVTRTFQITGELVVFTNAARMATVCKASDLHEAMVNTHSRTSINRTFNPSRDIACAELALHPTSTAGFSSYPQFGVLADSQFAVFLDEDAIQTVTIYPITWPKGLPSFTNKKLLQIKVEGGTHKNKIFLPCGAHWAVLSKGSLFNYPSNTSTEIDPAGRDVVNITPVLKDGCVIISTGQPRDPFKKIELC